MFLSNNNTQLSKIVLRKMCEKIEKVSNLDIHITPHQFRHTFATRMVEHGCDYKALYSILGHTSIYFTMHPYVNSQQDFLGSQINLIAK